MTRHSSEGTEVKVAGRKIDSFGLRLAMAMEMVGGSTSMAEKAGVSSSVLRKWRAGGSEPSRVNLINMAEAAGVRAGWLAFGEEPMIAGDGMPSEEGLADRSAGTVPFPLDIPSLEHAIESVKDAEEAVGIELRPTTYAKVVNIIYSSYIETQGWLPQSMVKQIIRLTAEGSS